MSTRIDEYPLESPTDGAAAIGLNSSGNTRRLSLGTAAEANVTTSATDTTAGRVLRIDDYLDRAGPSDSAWTVVTSLDNGWTGTVRYIKRAGMVTVVIYDLDETSASLAAAIELPAAYRPATTMRSSITKSGTTTAGRLNVTTGGLVQVLELNGSGIFGSITYPVL